MENLLAPAYRRFRYAVVVGRKMDDDIVDSIQAGPTRQYSSLYHQVNRELSEVLDCMAKALSGKGIENQPIYPTVSDDEVTANYYQTLRLDFSHKMVATRAGIGWIGKTDLLVTRRFGPRVRLASLLVDYPIPNPGTPIVESSCGRCDVCVKACPAQAATGQGWHAGIDRDEFFNAFQCREKCRELSLKHLGEVISLCGICVSVCPVGKSRASVLTRP